MVLINLRICGYHRFNKAYSYCGCEVGDIRTAFDKIFFEERGNSYEINYALKSFSFLFYTKNFHYIFKNLKSLSCINPHLLVSLSVTLKITTNQQLLNTRFFIIKNP